MSKLTKEDRRLKELETLETLQEDYSEKFLYSQESDNVRRERKLDYLCRLYNEKYLDLK